MPLFWLYSCAMFIAKKWMAALERPMGKRKEKTTENGYFGIGILHCENEQNIGTLWRSAYILGASFIFTIDAKYKKRGTDSVKAWTKIPLYYYKDFEDFHSHLPHDCRVVAVEMDESATHIVNYNHPDRCIYLLGCESIGLGREIMSRCHEKIHLPGHYSLNVAVAGSIVMYDRHAKACL